MDSKEKRYGVDSLVEELGVPKKDVEKLYSIYFDEMKIEIIKMREHAAKCNWGMLERVTHNIKGMSSSLYVNDVYEKAAEFNSLLKNNQTENTNIYIEEITQLLKNAEIEIKEYFL